MSSSVFVARRSGSSVLASASACWLLIAASGLAPFVASAADKAVLPAPAVVPSKPPEPQAPIYDQALAKESGSARVVLAGGRFWGMQAVFQHVKGVLEVTAGYMGGDKTGASYERVLRGGTGHLETVEVRFDPSKITIGTLLEVYFFIAHDPTQLNRQGEDRGLPFRSAIFYDNVDQRRIARAYMDQLTDSQVFTFPITTKLYAADVFYPAEGYLQNYVQNHATERYVIYNDLPKVARLKEALPKLYRAQPLRYSPYSKD